MENLVWPISGNFLEVVAPVHDNTAAGRYLDRKGANVVLARAFHRKKLPDGIAEFVADALAAADVALPSA